MQDSFSLKSTSYVIHLSYEEAVSSSTPRLLQGLQRLCVVLSKSNSLPPGICVRAGRNCNSFTPSTRPPRFAGRCFPALHPVVCFRLNDGILSSPSRRHRTAIDSRGSLLPWNLELMEIRLCGLLVPKGHRGVRTLGDSSCARRLAVLHAPCPVRSRAYPGTAGNRGKPQQVQRSSRY